MRRAIVGRWTADLFDSRTGDGRPAGRRPWTVGILAVVAGTLVSLLRQAGAGALDTVWAEDGQIFLSQAHQLGPAHALTTSYAGYFHVVPRLIAALAAAVPVSVAAVTLAVGAALVTALIAVLVYIASGEHLRTRLGRFLVAAVVVALPLGMEDLPNSIANLHWAGLYLVFWMLIWRPDGRGARAVAVLAVALVALSDILVLAYAPLAAIGALRRAAPGRRDRHGTALAAALAVGLVVQVLGLVTGQSSRDLSLDPVRVVSGYVLRAVPPGLLGEVSLGEDVGPRWLALAALAWLIVLGTVALRWRRQARATKVLAAVAGVHSLAVYALPVLLQGIATPRYAAAPAMLLLTGLVALAEPSPDERPSSERLARLPFAVLTVLTLVVWAVDLRVDNARAHGPSWSDELARARAACAAAPDDRVVQLVTPPVETPPWTVTLTCADLR